MAAEPLLSQVPVFAGLPAPRLEALEREARVVRVRAGEWLYRQGDPGGRLSVVCWGRLEVVQDGEAIRVLGPGAVLGELSFLTGTPRSASVRAVRDAELLDLDARVIERVLIQEPGPGGTDGAASAAGPRLRAAPAGALRR